MEANDENHRILAEAILKSTKPLEKITAEQIIKAKEEHALVLEKMSELIEQFSLIEKELPPSNLEEYTNRINSVCDRLEACKLKVKRVIKRADNMIIQLNKPIPQPKTGNLID